MVVVLVGSVLCSAGLASSALAAFPYLPATGGNPHDPSTFKLAPGEAPNDFSESGDWEFAGTPETGPLSDASVNFKQDELCGVRGGSVVDRDATQPTGCQAGQPVRTAWQVTTGRPDVTIAVLDSGIKWNDTQAMTDLRAKVHLRQGELPAPRHDLSAALAAGQNCAQFHDATGGDHNAAGNYDVNGDGVFNVLDYACDSRVQSRGVGNVLRHGPSNFLTPEDLILAFSDGIDQDHNGYVDDIAGWDFVDNKNDPFDDVQYGHGTGEARDSNAEADNGGGLGTCPNCTVVPLRVGESFIADANRFAEATIYAADNGASVVQEALGTLNAPLFARQAIDYAYNHGVTVIASAADEAAEHHNQPGSLPHTVVVNSVTQYADGFTSEPRSYLQFNGCTNFSTRVDVSVASTSCSSDAAGKGAGVAGLIYSAALNARDAHTLGPSGHCKRTDGSACPITANEVGQLMASGSVAGAAQADDVNFAQQPEPSCGLALPTCTDPNSNTIFAADQAGGTVAPLANSHRYHARKGFDEFYGYGRLNSYNGARAAADAHIPPEADITSPDWFQKLDPRAGQISLGGYVNARTSYTCRVYVAPGAQPNNADAPAGDFVPVSSSYCDGSTAHTSEFRGTLAQIDVAALKARFPPGNPGSFDGNENGGIPQTSNGRPNTEPYAFTAKVVVTTTQGTPMSGQDRRQFFLHRDRDLLPHFPIEMKSDGDSSPVLADLNGDNRNELVVANSDGVIHAYRSNGSELKGWPVRTDSLPLHAGGHAYRASDGVGRDHRNAVIGALAAGDLFHDGRIEIVADDNGGNVYAWDSKGRRVFHRAATARFSGAPLTPFHTVRQGPRDRTEHGFIASPVLADLSGKRRSLDIVVPGEDRHLYAWHPNGTAVKGFPVLMADPNKVASVDPQTHRLTFNGNASKDPGIDEDQGKVVDTPAVAYLDGPNKPPSIVVGTNEEYAVGTGNEGAVNAGGITTTSLPAIGATGILKFANGRVYVVNPDGGASGHPFRPGWPAKVGILDRGLLPDVGEGINGSPVVAQLTCPQGGAGPKIGVTPDAGPGYIFNADGSSCFGRAGGQDNALETDFSAGSGQYDHPAFAAVGYPAFGSFDGKGIDFLAPATGLLRAVDVAAPEYQGGQDFLASWDPQTSQFRVGFPSPVNDLQFLTGPVVGDVLGQPGRQQALGGTASLDLAAIDSGGGAASPAWPKLTGDWTVATPTLGSFGTLDTDPAARKDVVETTRFGSLSVYGTPAAACSPSSSPRFHHDLASSGDFARDAVPPGKVFALHGGPRTFSFRAPGDDLLCGTAARYELVQSSRSITPANFGSLLAHGRIAAPAPAAAGATQRLTLPSSTAANVAIRAVDEQGNLGPIVFLKKAPRASLRLAVSPRRVRARRRSTFSFRVTAAATGRPVSGALVRFSGHSARTDRSGRVRMTLTLRRIGRHRAVASRSGAGSATAYVRAVRRAGFTG